jgi:hypothetical protein
MFNSPYSGFFAFLFKLGGSRTVVIINDLFFIDYEKKNIFDHYSWFIYKVCSIFCDRLISTSELTALEFEKTYKRKTDTLYLGVSNIFNKIIKNSLKNKKVEPTIIYIGAYENQRKRVQYLLKFLDLPDSSQFHYIFAGPIKEEFISELRNTRSKNYKIYGRVDAKKKVELFEKSSFIYFPSRLEGTGLPIVEALKSGVVPIVQSDAKIPEVIKEPCVKVKGPKGALREMINYLESPEDFNEKILSNYEYSGLFDYNNYVVYLMRFYA